ncbi:MAG: type 2 isopentenyl-diphosphate Delta-isomerase [Candidatus Micrarchaeota archaeon]|nr:type 2 isopentenyl-diphosphate Delta-isomerase [Candidatus Micrarchaeota archaeon]
MKMDIRGRKREHVESARRRDVEYSLSPGFGDVRFVHQPLPEMALDDVDTECRMFGKMLSAPIIILGMTGGYPDASKINARLAAAAEKEGLAFGLGSQRAMIEKPSLASTYKVRKVAPTIPLIGNIGGCQLKKYGVKKVREALDIVEADALAIHLNPLQEVCQPEGDHDFSGILLQIGIFCRDLGLPVIVKETGAGMSMNTAIALRSAGVCMADVSGAGGTSWSKVEYMRSGGEPVFENWGNPTCVSIAACSEMIETIGSGGVRNGLDAAKALALGAAYAGAALPFLRASDPAAEAASWKRDLKIAMLLSCSKNLWALHRARIVISGKTAEEMKRIGVDVHRYARR